MLLFSLFSLLFALTAPVFSADNGTETAAAPAPTLTDEVGRLQYIVDKLAEFEQEDGGSALGNFRTQAQIQLNQAKANKNDPRYNPPVIPHQPAKPTPRPVTSPTPTPPAKTTLVVVPSPSPIAPVSATNLCALILKQSAFYAKNPTTDAVALLSFLQDTTSEFRTAAANLQCSGAVNAAACVVFSETRARTAEATDQIRAIVAAQADPGPCQAKTPKLCASIRAQQLQGQMEAVVDVQNDIKEELATLKSTAQC